MREKNMKLEQNQNSNIGSDIQRGVLLETKHKTKKPSMYNVLLLNDNYTPMEFVVLILEKIFNKKLQNKITIKVSIGSNFMLPSLAIFYHKCFTILVRCMTVSGFEIQRL